MASTSMQFDFHTHSLLSDGVLLPSELARRYACRGYKAVAVTDHVDHSNIEAVVSATVEVAAQWNAAPETEVVLIPGAEITHVAPSQMAPLIRKARELGAKIVVVHGETISEPVAPGTNRAAVEGRADILAHPGLISEDDTRLAAENSVFLEITTRGGHCLTNGHVALTARRAGAALIIDSDSHAPGDIPGPELTAQVGQGAGLSQEDLAELMSKMAGFAKKSI